MNGFESVAYKVGHGLKVGVEDLVKVAEWIPEHLAQTVKVLDDVVKDSPAVRADLKTLIGKVAVVDGMVAKDIVERGLNPVDDLGTLIAIKDLIEYLKDQFFPTIESAYKELAADVQSAA